MVVGKYRVEKFDEFHQFIVFGMKLFLHEASELAEAHVDDSLCLRVIEAETLAQCFFCVVVGLRLLDNSYHLVDVVGCNDKAFDYVGASLRFAFVEHSAANYHIMTVVDEMMDKILQVK